MPLNYQFDKILRFSSKEISPFGYIFVKGLNLVPSPAASIKQEVMTKRLLINLQSFWTGIFSRSGCHIIQEFYPFHDRKPLYYRHHHEQVVQVLFQDFSGTP